MLTCLSLCSVLAIGVSPLPVMAKAPTSTDQHAVIRDFSYGRLFVHLEDNDFIILEKTPSPQPRHSLLSIPVGSAVKVDAALIERLAPPINGGSDAKH